MDVEASLLRHPGQSSKIWTGKFWDKACKSPLIIDAPKAFAQINSLPPEVCYYTDLVFVNRRECACGEVDD